MKSHISLPEIFSNCKWNKVNLKRISGINFVLWEIIANCFLLEDYCVLMFFKCSFLIVSHDWFRLVFVMEIFQKIVKLFKRRFKTMKKTTFFTHFVKSTFQYIGFWNAWKLARVTMQNELLFRFINNVRDKDECSETFCKFNPLKLIKYSGT